MDLRRTLGSGLWFLWIGGGGGWRGVVGWVPEGMERGWRGRWGLGRGMLGGWVACFLFLSYPFLLFSIYPSPPISSSFALSPQSFLSYHLPSTSKLEQKKKYTNTPLSSNKQIFKAMQAAYIRLLQNPFYDPDEHCPVNGKGGKKIVSRRFVEDMRRIGEGWVPGVVGGLVA